jgi:hypothetical protein
VQKSHEKNPYDLERGQRRAEFYMQSSAGDNGKHRAGPEGLRLFNLAARVVK